MKKQQVEELIAAIDYACRALDNLIQNFEKFKYALESQQKRGAL